MPKRPINSVYDRVQKHRQLKKKRESFSSSSSDGYAASIISDCSKQSDISGPSRAGSPAACTSYDFQYEDNDDHPAVSLEVNNTSLLDDSTGGMNSDEEVRDASMVSHSSSSSDVGSDDLSNQSESENAHNDRPNLRETLRLWAVRNISTLNHNVITDLLQDLRSLGHKLPSTADALLQTKRTPAGLIENMALKNGQTGRYAYFGIEQELAKRISPEIYKEDKIKVIINVDGLPLYRNSKQQFWPILMQVSHEKYVNKPFVVGIFAGPGKPNTPNVFLKDFIPEAAELTNNGLTIQGKLYSFEIIAFVCDTPARAYLKCVKSHVAFSSCERCTVRGKTINHRRVFANSDCQPRTSETFRNRDDPGHHLDDNISPLLEIPDFDIVKSVILDYMHLLCVGIMKALLQKWMSGNILSRIQKRKIEILCQLLISLQNDIPSEFQRKKLDLNDLANWKATQYRFFILYCGALLLEQILPLDKYKHFMLLFAACRILCGRETAVPMVDTAVEYLRNFFILLPTLYGTESQVMNFHNLLHIADDVRHLGMPLSDFSTFPFENTLAMLKKLIRTPRLPLSQICRRLSEMEMPSEDLVQPHALIIKSQRKMSSNQCQYNAGYKEMILKGMRIRITHPNNVVQLQNGNIVEIKKIFALREPVQSASDLKVEGQLIEISDSAFDYPCDSEVLGIYEIGDHPSVRTVRFLASEIKKKCFKLSVEQRTYCLSLLH